MKSFFAVAVLLISIPAFISTGEKRNHAEI